MPLDPTPITECGVMNWVPGPLGPTDPHGHCRPNCYKYAPGLGYYVPDINPGVSPKGCPNCDDPTCTKCGYMGGESCVDDTRCPYGDWAKKQIHIPWLPLLTGVKYSGSNPDDILGDDTKWSYEIIPGLNRSWCPWYQEYKVHVAHKCFYDHFFTWSMGISFYYKSIEPDQIFSTLSPGPTLPPYEPPICDARNNFCWAGHTDFVMHNGLSDNMRLGVDHEQRLLDANPNSRWFTSISSYGTKTLVNRNGVFYGNTFRGYGTAHTQGMTFSTSFNENTINAVSLFFTNIQSGEYYYAVDPSGSMGLSVLASPYFMDGNKSKNIPQIIFPGISMNDCGSVHGHTGCTCNNCGTDILQQDPTDIQVFSGKWRNAIAASGLPWLIKDKATGIEMVLIPGGTFMMGFSESEPPTSGGVLDENPIHEVIISKSFYMSRHQVTQAQWKAAMGKNPSFNQSRNSYTQQIDCTNPSTDFVNCWEIIDNFQRPVEEVSWDDVQSFNAITGFRLPTEAEWEYAYRADSEPPPSGGAGGGGAGVPGAPNRTAYFGYYWPGYVGFGSSGLPVDIEPRLWPGYNLRHWSTYSDTPGDLSWEPGMQWTYWFRGTSCVGLQQFTNGATYTFGQCRFNNGQFHTQPVGVLRPNGAGIYDMGGNVYEWCQDWYSDTYYASSPILNPTGPATGNFRVVRGGSSLNDVGRASDRLDFLPTTENKGLGFRVVKNTCEFLLGQSFCSASGCSACTDMVCKEIPTCCSTSWGQNCVNKANSFYNIGGTSTTSFIGSNGIQYNNGDPFPPRVLCGTTGGYDPGTTGEGDVFASVWQNYSGGYTEYKPYGLDYYSVSPKGSSAEVLRNYPNYRDGVFGERPDLILFRLANNIYPLNWMVGFSGCTAPFLANNRIEGQTACIIDPLNCDQDKYTQSQVYYNQVAVGARHALVTMGEYIIGPDTTPIKTFPYLIQFSGQTFGQIDEKPNWSTMNFDLSLLTGLYSTRKLITDSGDIFSMVTGISYSNQKDKLYKHGISGETAITQEWDLENDSCSFKNGNVINPLLCGFGLTSCFKYGITLGHKDHPIWNHGVDNIPYVSVISAKSICAQLHLDNVEMDKCSWDWISAGNTGESCAILRCEFDDDTLERHTICWGNRYDQATIPIEAWEPGTMSNKIEMEESGYMPRNCIDDTFTNTYHPCQIDIKGSSPVIYYRSYPYDLVGGMASTWHWDPAVPTALDTYNIRGKTKYYTPSTPTRVGAWSLVDSFGDATRTPPNWDRGLRRNHVEMIGLDGYERPEMRETFGPQFVPNYPIISSNAWLKNRYNSVSYGNAAGGDCCNFTTGVCCNGTQCTETDNLDCSEKGGDCFYPDQSCTTTGTICNGCSSSSSSSSSGGGGGGSSSSSSGGSGGGSSSSSSSSSGGGGGQFPDCCEFFIGPCCTPPNFTKDTCEILTPNECGIAKGIFLGFGHLCEECDTL